MKSTKHWAPSADVKVYRVEQSGSGDWTVFASLGLQGICPGCGSLSKQRHSWRHRHLQDFAAQVKPVTVTLRVCRWRCSAPACRRRTFSDQTDSVADPFARRTLRTAQIIRYLGHSTGGRSAERLTHRLGIPVSDRYAAVCGWDGDRFFTAT